MSDQECASNFQLLVRVAFKTPQLPSACTPPVPVGNLIRCHTLPIEERFNANMELSASLCRSRRNLSY